MGALRSLLLIGCLLLHTDLVSALLPLLASSQIFTVNPTTTTIILEKPYCFLISNSPVTVNLYVVQNGAPTLTTNPLNTWYTTSAGKTAPYLAASFPNPNCTVPSTSDIYDATKAAADQYVIRVGSEAVCSDPTLCNGQLNENTAYRFKFDFVPSTGVVSEWSPPITTRKAKSSAIIDTWPGGRSGGMIVITSILSVCMFFILAGLVAAIITNLMSPTTHLPTTVHSTQSSNPNPVPKVGPTTTYENPIATEERYATTNP